MIKKYKVIILLFVGTVICSGAYAQSRIGISSNAVFNDFYYPVIPEASIGIEGGVVFQQDSIFKTNKLRFHSELSLMNRWKNSTKGELTEMLIHLGFGYKLGSNRKIYFEPVVGVYSKIKLQYDNFYDLGREVETKFFTIGVYLKPQMNIEISEKYTFSIFTSTRFDISPTFYDCPSGCYGVSMFTLLSGVQLTYKLNGNEK